MTIPNHIWVALSNWLSRAGSVIAQLICLPMLSTALSASEFAAYAITISLLTWYQLLDFGFGNSTQNQVAESRARGENIGAHIAVAGTLGLVVILSSIIVLFPLSHFLTPILFSKIPLLSSSGSQRVILISGFFLVGNTLGQISQKILYAMGKGVYANLITLTNSMVFLLLLWKVASHVEPSNRFLMCVLAYTSPMGVTGIISLGYLCWKYGHWNISAMQSHIIKLLPYANKFCIFAFLAAAVLNVDYLIMSQTLSAQDIATYNVLFRVYWIGMALYSGLLTATWPVFSTMAAHGDWNGIFKQIKIYLFAGLGSLLVGSIIIAPILPTLFHLIAPGLHIQASITTLALFSLYIGLRVWTDTYATALQATSEIGIFLKVVPIQAAISISAQLILVPIFGINGVLLGLISSFIFTVAWILPKQLKKQWHSTEIYSLRTT